MCWVQQFYHACPSPQLCHLITYWMKLMLAWAHSCIPSLLVNTCPFSLSRGFTMMEFLFSIPKLGALAWVVLVTRLCWWGWREPGLLLAVPPLLKPNVALWDLRMQGSIIIGSDINGRWVISLVLRWYGNFSCGWVLCHWLCHVFVCFYLILTRIMGIWEFGTLMGFLNSLLCRKSREQVIKILGCSGICPYSCFWKI